LIKTVQKILKAIQS